MTHPHTGKSTAQVLCAFRKELIDGGMPDSIADSIVREYAERDAANCDMLLAASLVSA